MSIKSDKWIRRMAETTGMIEPFEPGQIRQADGKKIISYGTSSYGYDIRCAPEFKVFTNIHSTGSTLKILTKRALSIFTMMCASSRLTALPWPALWSTFVFPAMY
jgi:deoxycytidine triphosphate deaminase